MPFLRSDLYFEQILILYVNFFNVIKLNLAWPKYVSELWDHLLLELWRLKWLYCLGQGGCFVFSPLRPMKQKSVTVLPWIWGLIIYQTKDKGYNFRLLEWDLYWKQDLGLRALHWLPSNFYLIGQDIHINNMKKTMIKSTQSPLEEKFRVSEKIS